MPSYLDYHGLQTFKGELDDIFGTKLDANKRGVANGVASLDANGKVPVSQIPEGGGGGGQQFVVTISRDNNVYSSDKTVAEIVEAIEAGNTIYVIHSVVWDEPVAAIVTGYTVVQEEITGIKLVAFVSGNESYTFTISDLDAGVVNIDLNPSSVISDLVTASGRTWSSQKITSELSDLHVYKFSWVIPANSTSSAFEMGFAQRTWTGNPAFSSNARVVGYNFADTEYYEDIEITIDTRSVSGSVTVLPGASSNTLEVLIADAATV